MSEEKLQDLKRAQNLRVVSPKLYHSIITELEKQNIHSYDVQINAMKEDKGIHVILRFGESFTYEKEQFLPYEVIETNGEELVEFAKTTGEACKEVMINEYYKMMKP